MSLYAVCAGGANATRRVPEKLDRFLDIFQGHRLAREPVKRLVLARRAQCLIVNVLNPAVITLAARMADLDNEPAIVLVNLVYNAVPELNPIVSVNRRVIRQNSSPDADRNKRRDYRANAAASKLFFPVDTSLCA